LYDAILTAAGNVDCHTFEINSIKKRDGTMLHAMRLGEITIRHGQVALRVLSFRLADLAKNTDATPEQERDQTQIIRILNLLVIANPAAAPAQSN
jgi:hypothetical protein